MSPKDLEACRQGRRVLFTKLGAMLTDLAGGSWRRRLQPYLSPDLLILDDFGMREYAPTQAEDLYEPVSKRYRRGSLVLTTNREPRDIYALLPRSRPCRGPAGSAVEQRPRDHHARSELPSEATTGP